ncbi:MAG: hypothetical protein IJB52_13850, partial [Clostridia bacterium]|nr:hypothetical protein [Clostridia bacterium]
MIKFSDSGGKKTKTASAHNIGTKAASKLLRYHPISPHKSDAPHDVQHDTSARITVGFRRSYSVQEKYR